MEELGYNGNQVTYNVKRHQLINERLTNIEAALRKNITGFTMSE